MQCAQAIWPSVILRIQHRGNCWKGLDTKKYGFVQQARQRRSNGTDAYEYSKIVDDWVTRDVRITNKAVWITLGSGARGN